MYPDRQVQEIAKSFVCIRVGFDAHPDIAAKYGVGPLTDIRLLEPEGRERAKLVGYSSAAKLLAECRRVLDLMSGKSPASPGPASAEIRKVEVTPDALTAAVSQGIRFLHESRRKGWDAAAPGMAPDDLVLFTWAVCDVDPKEEEFAKLRDSVLGAPLLGTYQAAFRAMALLRLDPKSPQIKDCAAFLLRSQLDNGQWTYGPGTGGGSDKPTVGDNSNTAYALLGLAACRKAGVEVPEGAIRKAEGWWRSAQREDGGWGYRTDREAGSYASMTENGIGSLLICARMLDRQAGEDPAVARALTWLSEHFSVTENRQSPYQQGRRLYHLYSLERIMSFRGVDSLAGHDAYREGAAYLLGTQHEDGSWDDGADTPVPNTCLALLCLCKSSRGLWW